MARSRRRKTQNQPLRPWQLLLLVLIGGAIYLYNEGYFDRYLKDFLKDPTSTPPVAQGNGEAPPIQLSKAVGFSGLWYQVYFTRPDYPEKAEGRSGGIEDAMIADINAAKSSVRLAVYEFDRTPVADALIAAKQRGLTVEMVFDAENLDDPEMATEIGRIEQAGIPITYENSEAFMHNKILLLDDTVVWTGSMNLTRNDVYRNNNNMIRSSLAPLVENYRVRFADLFAGRFGSKSRDNTPNHEIDLDGGVKIENYFSPSDGARAYLLGYLKTAQSSIKVLAFSFTDDATAQELIALHGRGGDVRVVMETRNADGTGSEFGTLAQAGISVLRDANCYTAHNKIIVIDERVVITGSYNFTARAEDTNDENLLIISDPTLAKYYSDEFERLYAQAQAGSRCGG